MVSGVFKQGISILKFRKAKAAPCGKKGADNHFLSNACECQAPCESRGGYLKNSSPGTSTYNQKENLNFPGCLEIEQGLLNENLLRYDDREISGLDVLFNGIEKIYDLNASIFNDAFLTGYDVSGIVHSIDTDEHDSTIEHKLVSGIDLQEKRFKPIDEEIGEKIPNECAVRARSSQLAG